MTSTDTYCRRELTDRELRARMEQVLERIELLSLAATVTEESKAAANG
jgi:hypothetical protein